MPRHPKNDSIHVCGLYYWEHPIRKYLPPVSLAAHTTIINSVSRTTLTQAYRNGSETAIPQLRYTFPLYDGVSVVGFICTINKSRVIHGVVKERSVARQTFDAAVARGETAGLLEQLPEASDVFTTTISNIPANAEIEVRIEYLGELKHDAEVDGVRFTIPTSIAPRYGEYPGELLPKQVSRSAVPDEGISIIVDAEMPAGCNIKSVQSPTHPISVSIGSTSTSAAGDELSLQKASATLSLGTAELDSDFVLHVVATNASTPLAVLETHPTIANHRAMMVTLVPKFSLPTSRPEIVFICDRSGSMGSGAKIPNLKAALQIFLRSLPVGVKFNIVSFGSRHEFLFKNGSRSYDASSLAEAERYVEHFSSNFGGTEMYQPLEQTFLRRYKDMALEVFLLTDGEIWNQESLFGMVTNYVEKSKGHIRLFSLGIGRDASHALIEGIARAGNGFAQSVGDNEKMNAKVVRMLKAALTPHVKDYTLEVKYSKDTEVGAGSVGTTETDGDDGFEVIERVMDSLAISMSDSSSETVAEKAATPEHPKKTISLFDPSADPDTEMVLDSGPVTADNATKYAHVPPVAPPKLLQTPSNIPPLFPFSRTSVYLFLGPGTTQKTPKSVILRGTSIHGPLHLEIPVTLLPQPGQTIHQLAARSAVKDLEEGRGWIFAARETVPGNSGEGKLLKDKFQGRFSDMVEREAVRLGVQFQVGGKWCSFVAVEENDKGDNPQVVRELQGQHETFSSVVGDPSVLSRSRCKHARLVVIAASSSFTGLGSIGSGPGHREPTLTSNTAVPPPPPAPVHQFRQLQPLHPGGTHQQHYGENTRGLYEPMAMSPRAMASVPSSFGGGSGFFPTDSAMPSSSIMCGVTQAQLSKTASKTRSTSRHRVLSKRMAPAVQKEEASRAYNVAASAEGECENASEDGDESVSFSLFDVGVPMLSPSDEQQRKRSLGASGTSSVQTDTLESLVSLQSFNGSWAWQPRLQLFLQGVSEADAKKIVTLESWASGLGVKQTDEVLATACVVSYLRMKLRVRKEEWEMIEEKAVGWLTGTLGSEEAVERLLSIVTKLF